MLPPVEDDFAPAGRERQPVTLLDNLAAWAATLGILLLLAGGIIVAAVVWFVSVALSMGTPDEAAGE